jgi:hypothetical protein
MIKILEKEISALDKAIDELVSSEPGLQSLIKNPKLSTC